MLYLTGEGISIIVLETENIEKIKAGMPAKTPDSKVLIGWTPDPAWLAEQIANSNGDGAEIGRLLDEATKRPQAPSRPPHGTRTTDIVKREVMRWQYDDEGCWRAKSKHFNSSGAMYVSGDGNTPFHYLIYVSEDGEFVVDGSALIDVKSFPTFQLAKAYCEGNEKDIEAEKQ